MMRVWMLLLLLPAASASGLIPAEGPTDTTLWVHLDAFLDAPMSTTTPPEWFEQAVDVGLVDHSQGCVELPFTTMLNGNAHTSYAFVSPSPIIYEDGHPTYHMGRGLTYDLELAEHAPEVHWSLEAQWANDPMISDPPPATPRVVMHATLREGSDLSVGQTAFNTGQLIARGWTSPAELHPLLLGDHQHVTHHEVDGRHVFDFVLPLQLEAHNVRAQDGMNLRIDVFIENPACSGVDGYLMPDFVRWHTSEDHRPRLDLSVMDPLRLESVHPQIIGDDLVLNAAIASVWGGYDVALPEAMITLPDGTQEPLTVTRWKEHGSYHHGPLDTARAAHVTWAWPGAAMEPTAGIHTVEIQAANQAGTGFAIGNVDLDLVGKDLTTCVWRNDQSFCTKVTEPLDETTPVPVVLLIAALLWAARRR